MTDVTRVTDVKHVAVAALAAIAFVLLASAPALAVGRAASGELLHYPCTTCHPVAPGAAAAGTLPNGFERHDIVLGAHAALGEGSAACLVCHDDPARDPGLLKLLDGSLVDISGNTSLLCYACHFTRYREWEDGIHGREQESCTAAGCHDPHTPSWIYGEPLPPFTGTGFQVRAVSEREPFTPFAGPPVKAPVETPAWLVLATGIVAVVSLGIVGYLVRGRPTS